MTNDPKRLYQANQSLAQGKDAELWQSSSLDSTAHLASCVLGVEDLLRELGNAHC